MSHFQKRLLSFKRLEFAFAEHSDVIKFQVASQSEMTDQTESSPSIALGDLKNLESIAKTLKEQSETKSELILALASKLEEERVANKIALAKIQESISRAQEETKHDLESLANEMKKDLGEVTERIRIIEGKSQEMRADVDEELTSICNGNTAFKAQILDKIEALGQPQGSEEVLPLTKESDSVKRELARMKQQIKLLEWNLSNSMDDLQKRASEQRKVGDQAIELFAIDQKQLREALTSLKARNDDTTEDLRRTADAQWTKIDGHIAKHQGACEEMARNLHRLEVEVKGQGAANDARRKTSEERRAETSAAIRTLEREYMYCLKEIAKFHNK